MGFVGRSPHWCLGGGGVPTTCLRSWPGWGVGLQGGGVAVYSGAVIKSVPDKSALLLHLLG